RLVFFAKQREAIIEQLKAVDEELDKALAAVGLGKFVQDPETKVVYKVVRPEGRFVKFKDIDYIRTRKSVDEKGDLSMSAAMEAGFDLGELGPKTKKKA